MTGAAYDRKHGWLTITGHAGYAPRGESIVCAAMSILAYTAVSLAQEAGAKAEVRDGFVAIQGITTKALREKIDAVWRGIEIMAGNYPEYVKADKYE